MKATQIGITQDIRVFMNIYSLIYKKFKIQVDGGALFLYAIDKKFNSEVELQSNLYLRFLPYDADVE